MCRGGLHRKIALLVALAVLFAAATACTKQRASMSLKKLDKLLTLSEKYQAQKYEATQVKDVQTLREEAQRNYETQQYKTALDMSGKAVDTIKKVIESSRSKYAADRKQDAEEAIRLADINKGSEKDPERYRKIKDYETKAREKMAKNKWDDVILLSDNIVTEVENLLRPLKTDAERRQTTAINRFHEMQAQGAQEYAPNYVVTVQDLLNTVDMLIKERHDYLEAKNKAEETIQKIEEGVLKTKEKKSHKLLSFIEGELTTAYVKDAEIWAPEMYKDAQEMFDRMLRNFYEKNYDSVLMTEEDITSRVAKLIYVTRKSSANNKIETVQKAMDALVEGGVRDYLPGRVEAVQSRLDQAHEKFTTEDFEGTEAECLVALDLSEKIEADFNDLALEAMRSAGGALDVTQSVFDKMVTIFIVKPSETMTSLEREFENSKESFRTELGTLLRNARLSLGVAKLRQEDRQYRKAIQISGDVNKTAEYVLNEVYHVVAHNAIVELASQISKYEKDGAVEYASEELGRTKALLEEAKALTAQAKFKEAVAKASETRAQLDICVQALREKAIASIGDLKKSIEQAPETKTGDYKPDDLLRSQALLKEAESNFSAENLKPAIESAFKASNILSAASSEAARKWAEDEIENAHKRIALAESAGAANYAVETVDTAKNLLSQAKSTLAANDFIKAKDTAIRANQTAKVALYSLATDAESAITEAKNYGAWQQYSSELGEIILTAQKAREAVGRNDFATYRSFSEKARRDADALAVEVRNRTFKNRIAGLESSMQRALDAGANYFQPDQAQVLLKEIAQIEGEYSDSQFDLYRKKLDQIDARVEKMIADNPSVVGSIIEHESARLQQLVEERKARDYAAPDVENARKLLNFAQFDFKAERYRTAYNNVRKVMDVLNTIDAHWQDEQYRRRANELFSELTTAMTDFNQVLSLSPKMLVESSRGIDGKGQALSIAGASAPIKFRTSMDELVEKAAAVKPPPTQQTLHKHVLDTLNTARLAAVYFEKFTIFDQFDEAQRKDTIKKAFALIEQVKKKRNEIQSGSVSREASLRAQTAAAGSL